MPELAVTVTDPLTAADHEQVAELLAAANAATGLEPLSEQKRLDLRGGSTGFVAVLARHRNRPALSGYAHASRHPGSWAVEAVVHPEHQGGAELRRTLLAAALAEIGRRGGGEVRYWVSRPTPEDDATAAALGLGEIRDLLQMRVPLPLDAARRHGPAVPVRPFAPGADEDRWVEVNNRAFAAHPEQGGWTRAELLQREAEPWFDPAGFLVAEEGGRLVGSCWTKVHAEADPPMGEIYVISVDPEVHGRGLGRALTVAGLDWLARTGLRIGMLYVDADNRPAVELYRSLGFTVDHVDRAYTGRAEAPDGGRAIQWTPLTPTRRPTP